MTPYLAPAAYVAYAACVCAVCVPHGWRAAAILFIIAPAILWGVVVTIRERKRCG